MENVTNAVKVISMDDATATIGGYGVVFGGVDLEGETFTKDTDFRLDLVPSKLLLYDHAQQKAVKHDLGRIPNDSIKADDKGLWVEAQLDLHKAYAQEVIKLINAGVLGYSSGSVSHLAERADGVIKTWPIVEFSLTPTPAEPRTIGVDVIKTLSEIYPGLKALLPEAPEDGAVPDATAGDDVKEIVEGESIKMSEQEAATVADATQAPAPAPQADLSPVIKSLEAISEKLAGLDDRVQKVEKTPTNVPESDGVAAKGVNFNQKTKLGDDETKAYSFWVRTGDEGAIKASNATDMNIGTDADGGFAVPTSHHNEIIARRDDAALPVRLGVRRIPGVGTTVNVPVDNEADGEFVSTAEAAAFDLDAPALDQKAMTLVKYSKEVRLSIELLQDEDSRLMAFLSDFIGRGFAKTLNNLLITEVGTNGTSLKTFASTTVIAAGEPQDIVGNNDLSNYLDDAGSVGWVTRSSTAWDIYSLSGNPFQYANTPAGSEMLPNLLGYPVYYSTEATAPAASAKSIYFGNWNYVGWRESPGLTVLRDPYSNAGTGQVSLWYYTRQVFTTLIAEAIGYGIQASA